MWGSAKVWQFGGHGCRLLTKVTVLKKAIQGPGVWKIELEIPRLVGRCTTREREVVPFSRSAQSSREMVKGSVPR